MKIGEGKSSLAKPGITPPSGQGRGKGVSSPTLEITKTTTVPSKPTMEAPSPLQPTTKTNIPLHPVVVSMRLLKVVVESTVPLTPTVKSTVLLATDGLSAVSLQEIVGPDEIQLAALVTTNQHIQGAPQPRDSTSKEPQKESGKEDGTPLPNQGTKDEKKWTSFFPGNKLSIRGIDLTYVALIVKNGARVDQLNDKKVGKENEKWRKEAILNVIGDSPSIGVLGRFVVAQWNFSTKPKINYHNDSYFVLLFSSTEDRDEV